MSKKVTENSLRELIKLIKEKFDSLVDDFNTSAYSTYSSDIIEQKIGISETQMEDDINSLETKLTSIENGLLIIQDLVNRPLVEIRPVDDVLFITDDLFQYSTLDNDTTIVLPTVDTHNNLTILIQTVGDISLIFHNDIQWLNPIVQSNNGLYELSLTYVNSTIGWIGKYAIYGSN